MIKRINKLCHATTKILIAFIFITAIVFGTTGCMGETIYNVTNNINISVVEYSRSESENEPAPESIATIVSRVQDSVVEIYSFKSSSATSGNAGSGVIIGLDDEENAKTAYIITNHHVINEMKVIKVRLTSGEVFDATLIGGDPASDIAVIKIEKTIGIFSVNLRASWRSGDAVRVGDTAIVIGNPLGTLPGSTTCGIVSSPENLLIIVGDYVMELLQTDAAINHGNSGGGVFDDNGFLIGIATAKVEGIGIEGLGFAIPGDIALDIATKLIATHSPAEFGYIIGRWVFGASLADYYDNDNLTRPYTKVINVMPGSNAATAGIAVGDIIRQVTINGVTTNITNSAQFISKLYDSNFDIFSADINKKSFSVSTQRVYYSNPNTGSTVKTINLTQYKYTLPA